jgi:hypothetical protein
MTRSVKAQSTPPKALRSRPPPLAAAEETSGSAIAAASMAVWVEGAEIPALDPGGDEDLAIANRVLQSSTGDSGFIALVACKSLKIVLFQETVPALQKFSYPFTPINKFVPLYSLVVKVNFQLIINLLCLR